MEMNLANAVRFALDIALKATVLLLMTGVALTALRRASASSAEAVSAMIGVRALPSCRSRCRMRRIASRPSITGIWMSITIKSYFSICAFSTAIRPFSASSIRAHEFLR